MLTCQQTMDANTSDVGSMSVIEPQDSARRRVLQSPELLDLIFGLCEPEAVVQMSLVNRFYESTSAPRIYRQVVMCPSFWYCYDNYPRSKRDCNGTPTRQQSKYLTYTRALIIEAEKITYDLSECSFAGVEIVEHKTYPDYLKEYDNVGGTAREDKYDDDKTLAQVIGKNMSKLCDIRPSIVVDEEGATIPFKPAELRWHESDESDDEAPPSLSPPSTASPAPDEEKCPGMINYHVTSLVTRIDVLSGVVHTHTEVTDAAAAGKRNTRLHAFYPNLVKVVIFSAVNPYYIDDERLDALAALVDMGYKVVMAGYHQLFRDREYAKKVLSRLESTRKSASDLDELIDTLVDKVHKISVREYYANYGRYDCNTPNIDYFIRREEEYYRDQSIEIQDESNNHASQ